MQVIGKVFRKWQRVNIYVPSTRDVNIPLTQSEIEDYVMKTARFLSQYFGGATSITAKGYFVDNEGNLVIETVTIVYSFTRRLSRKQRNAVLLYSENLKTELGQETVLVEFGNEIRFV